MAFYKVRVSTLGGAILSIDHRGLVVYPKGPVECILTAEEYRLLLKCDNVHVEVLEQSE